MRYYIYIKLTSLYGFGTYYYNFASGEFEYTLTSDCLFTDIEWGKELIKTLQPEQDNDIKINEYKGETK